MRRLITLVALAVALTVSASEAAKPASKPAAAAKPAITKAQTQKGGAPKSGTVKASPSKGAAAKGTTSKSVKTAKTTPQVAKGTDHTKVSGTKADKSVKAEGAHAKGRSSTTTATTEGTRSGLPLSGTATSGIDLTAGKVGQKLEKNPSLRSKIEAKLQAAGYTGTAYEAGYGFKNVGQLNAATNMVQNQGTSFNLLKVLMTGTYVDPATHVVYRTQKLPDGTTQLVRPELATNAAPTLSLGQAKQAIAGGAVMPPIVVGTTTGTTTTSTSSTTASGSLSGTGDKAKARKTHTTTTTQPRSGGF